MPSEKRKAGKARYFQKAKMSRKYSSGRVLQEDMQGFLLTCNNREREATREAYNVLNEFADKYVGPEVKTDAVEDKDEVDEEDIDDAFDKEKSDLDEIKSKPVSERRFQSVESGAKNCVFIKTTLDDPALLVEHIIEEISENKVSKSRYILRMIPIMGTCKAYEKNMEELVNKILSKILVKGKEVSYCVMFKTRNNTQVKRDDVIRLVGSCVREQEAKSVVDLKNPDLGIVMEVIRSICCVGVTWNYMARKKYNLSELAQPATEAADNIGEIGNNGVDLVDSTACEKPVETDHDAMPDVSIGVLEEDVETRASLKADNNDIGEMSNEEGNVDKAGVNVDVAGSKLASEASAD